MATEDNNPVAHVAAPILRRCLRVAAAPDASAVVMNSMSRRTPFSSLLEALLPTSLLLLLPACGGGGGGGTPITPGPGPGPTRIAETAVYATEEGRNLLGVRDDGTAAPVPLSAPAMTAVRRFAVSPDGGAVAYVADCDGIDTYELYVREIGGSAPVKVSSLLNTFCDVMDFAWSPDSQRLAYRADGIVDDRAELFSVGRTGAGHYRVFQSGIVSIYITDDYGWSPDSRYLYCAMQQTSTQFELLLHDAQTGVEGAQAVLVVPPGRQIVDVSFSPDSRWITMRADHAGALGQFEVWRRPVDQAVPVIRSNGATGPTVKIGSYVWSFDSTWMAQAVYSVTSNAEVGVNVYRIDPSSSRRVFTGSFDALAWAPTRNELAVAGDHDPNSNGPAGELRVLLHDADANTLRTVSAPFTGGEQLRGEVLRWSPSGQKLAYVTRRSGNSDSVYQIVPGGTLAAVRASETGNLEVVTIDWSRGGTHLALLERNQGAAFHPGEWHVVGSDGRSSMRSGIFNTFSTSKRLRWSHDNARVVFAVDAAAGGPDRLRGAGLDGSEAVLLSSQAVSAALPFGYARVTLPAP